MGRTAPGTGDSIPPGGSPGSALCQPQVNKSLLPLGPCLLMHPFPPPPHPMNNSQSLWVLAHAWGCPPLPGLAFCPFSTSSPSSWLRQGESVQEERYRPHAVGRGWGLGLRRGLQSAVPSHTCSLPGPTGSPTHPSDPQPSGGAHAGLGLHKKTVGSPGLWRREPSPAWGARSAGPRGLWSLGSYL